MPPVAELKFDAGSNKRLRKRLAKLSFQDPKALRRISRKAGQKASKPIIKAARALTPERFGALRAAFGHVTRTYLNTGTVAIVIGARNDAKGKKIEQAELSAFQRIGKIIKPSKYAHLVESGTKPHEVSTVLPGPGGPRPVTFMHPGAKGRHMLERAYNANKGKAFNLLADVVKDELGKLFR